MDEINKLNEELTELRKHIPATIEQAVVLLSEVTRITTRIRDLRSNKGRPKTS